MKINKKLTLLGAIVGAVVVSGNANAAPTTDASGYVVMTNESISVTNVGSRDTFKACQIIKTKYNSSSDTIEYEFGPSWAGFIASTQGSSYSTMTPAEYAALGSGLNDGNSTGDTDIDNLVGAYANYLRTHNSYSSDGCSDMTVSGTTASLGVSNAGAYLILPTSTTYVYSAMVANIDMKPNQAGTDYVIDNTHASLIAKKDVPGAVAKSVSSTSATIGENYTYTVGVAIPNYPHNAQNTRVVISDTPASTISLQSITSIKEKGASLTIDGINIKKNGDTIGTISLSSSSGMTITFSDASTLTPPIEIEYTARLVNSNLLAGVAQDNGVSLTYPKDVYNSDNTSANQITKTASVAIKTFGIKVEKLDDQSQPLDGAEFTIYSDSGHTNAVDCYGPAGGTTQPQTTITTNSSYEQGTAYCKGLKAGTYYLVETKPPIGYVAAAETVIQLNESTATDGVTGITGADTGFYTATVLNNRNIFALPFTGGRGVIIYAIVGVGIVSIASVYYYRKKSSKLNK